MHRSHSRSHVWQVKYTENALHLKAPLSVLVLRVCGSNKSNVENSTSLETPSSCQAQALETAPIRPCS